MGKYKKLSEKFKNINKDTKNSKTKIRKSFKEIEEILGFPLPESAYNHRAWWSNDRTHSHAREGWLNNNWITENIDIEQQLVEFRKFTWQYFQKWTKGIMESYFKIEFSLVMTENQIKKNI